MIEYSIYRLNNILFNPGSIIYEMEKRGVKKYYILGNIDYEKGLYIFVRDGKITYIGSTMVSLRSRIKKHKKYDGEMVVFFHMENYDKTEIRRLEQGLTLLYTPEKNNLSKFDKIR